MKSDTIRRIASRKTILSLAIFLFLLIAADSLATEYTTLIGSGNDRVEINRLDARKDGSADCLNYNDIGTLEEMFPKGRVSYLSEVDSVLSVQGAEVSVKVDLTDENFCSYSGLDLSHGSYFDENAMKLGRNVAVISEKLSNRLFMSLNAIGNEVRLFDKSFTIVGLYREAETITSLLGSDGSDRVFIPFTSYSGMMNQPFDTLFIRDPSLEDEKFKQSTIKNRLVKEIGINAKAYRIIDYFRSEILVSQWNGILLFVLAIWIGFLLIKLAGCVLKREAAEIREGLKQHYLAELIKNRPFSFVTLTITVLLIAVCGAAIIIWAIPRIFVPAQYIPPDNLFDANFYFKKITEAIFRSNAERWYTPTVTEQRFHNVLAINAVLFLFAIPTLMSLNTGLNLLIAARTKASTQFRTFLVSCGVVVLLCMIATITGAFLIILRVKTILTVAIFLLAKMIFHLQKEYVSSRLPSVGNSSEHPSLE